MLNTLQYRPVFICICCETMCRWMGSYFHDWIDNNGVAFSIKVLEWGQTFFLIFGVRLQVFILKVSKRTRMFVL